MSVSVVVATYHNPPRYSDREFVDECVASIRSQTASVPIQVIVADMSPDFSAGLTNPVVGANRTVILDERSADMSICAVLRHVLSRRYIEGEWLIPMNADDQLAPNFVESAFEAAGQWEHDHAPYRCGVVVVSQQPLTAAIERDNYIPYLAMFARWFWNEMGGFQDVLGEGGACRLADWDLWIRIWQRYGDRAPVAYVTDPSVIRIRNRPDSASKWSSDEFLELRSRLWKARGIEP
jgi:hypothetical protein